MTTNVPFLTTPYSGYFHSDVPPEDEELTHAGPGTPGGEWLRRFWQPVALSEDLKDLPKAIRIMNEDLVAFRDRSGRAGLLELHCSHRGTSLEFGQIEERGIRCCYHAWLYDVTGKVLETPGEPAESTLKDRLYHGAYPTHECAGIVFAYMGPPDRRPAFPMYDFYTMPGYHLETGASFTRPCNWLQMHDNIWDPSHLLFLHSIEGNRGFAEDFAQASEWEFLESPLGLIDVDVRRAGDLIWVRVGDYLPPNITSGPDVDHGAEERFKRDYPGRTERVAWTVPVDDTTCIRFGVRPVRDGVEPARDVIFGQLGGRPYEERQRTPGDDDAQISQRPIAVHALENLAYTDRGVIKTRNQIRDGIRAVQRGESPPGVTFDEGKTILTCAHDKVLRIPPAPTEKQDRLLLRDTGRKVAEARIKEMTQA